MGRTADSYLREAGASTVQPTFEFADDQRWPSDKLQERLGYLVLGMRENSWAGDRLAAVQRELRHIIFENNMREGLIVFTPIEADAHSKA